MTGSGCKNLPICGSYRRARVDEAELGVMLVPCEAEDRAQSRRGRHLAVRIVGSRLDDVLSGPGDELDRPKVIVMEVDELVGPPLATLQLGHGPHAVRDQEILFD